MKFIRIAALIFYAFSVQQCTPPVASSSKADVPLKETYWKLTEVYGKSVPVDSATFRPAHLVFKETENRVVGNGGCNSVSGTYTLADDDRISFSNMISTKMACPNLDTETQFLNALQAVDSYQIKGDTLMLTKTKTDILAKFARSAAQ